MSSLLLFYGALFQERGSKKRGPPIGTYLCRLFREKMNVCWRFASILEHSGQLKTPGLQLLPNAGYLSGEIISNYDDDDNDNDDVLCTCITLFSKFLWRPLHDYDVKPPNLTFYGGRGHTTTNFPCSFWTWIKSLRIQLQEKSPVFDVLSGSKQTRLSFFFLATFSLLSSSSLLKFPYDSNGEEKGNWHSNRL